jgi:aspartate kinase
MHVLKFGGTSIGTPNQIKRAFKIPNYRNNNIIVLSAFSGITNLLSEFIRQSKIGNWIVSEQILKIIEDNHLNITNRLLSSTNFKKIAVQQIKQSKNILEKFLDKRVSLNEENKILAQGELLSLKIIYLFLLEQEIDVALIHAFNYMKLNEQREPDLSFITKALKKEINKYPSCRLFITSGFICKDHKNKIDNLGRGGSDYTATIIGNVLNASIVEIWTDIDGLHNNDPRFVENTQAIRHISYNEASELAYFGAKILHPLSIVPVQKNSIPVVIKNTLDPENQGTVISDYSIPKKIKAIAAKDRITTIKIRSGRMMQAYGFLRKVFEVFEKYETSVDMLTTSEVSVAMTIENISNINNISKELSLLGDVKVESNQTIVCIVGDFCNYGNESIQKIVDTFDSIPIQMISFGSNKINISFVIDSEYKIEALNALNNCVLEEVKCLVNN